MATNWTERVQTAREAGFSDEEIREALATDLSVPAEELDAAFENPFETPASTQPFPEVPAVTPEGEVEFPGQPEPAKQPGEANDSLAVRQALSAGFTYEQIAKGQVELGQAKVPESKWYQILPGTDDQYPEPEERFKKTLAVGSEEPEAELVLPKYEVFQKAKEMGVDPTTVAGINAIYQKEQESNFRSTAASKVANFQALTNQVRPWGWISAQFGEKAQQEYDAMSTQNVQTIKQLGQARGLQLDYIEGQWHMLQNGEAVRIDPSMWQELAYTGGETAGSIAGWVAGGKIGAMLRLTGPYGAKAKTALAFSGAIGGAVLGNQTDYLAALAIAQEEFDAKVARDKALSTAQLAVLGEVGGSALYALGAGANRMLTHAINQVKDGNTEGAYRALKLAHGGLTDDEVQEIVERWSALHGEAPQGNLQQQALQVLPRTTGGGELAVSKASSLGENMSAVVRTEINNRAQTLRKTIESTTDASTGVKIQEDLRAYKKYVSTYYDQVKQMGSDLAPRDYAFNLENISIKPVLRHKIETINDPAVVDKLTRTLQRIDDLTDTRSFDDLLELRQVVNEFSRNKNLNHKDIVAVKEAQGSINAEIDRVMDSLGEAGAMWKKDFELANKEYAAYSALKKNALYKTLVPRSVEPKVAGSAPKTEETMARALLRYGPGIDTVNEKGQTTYVEVISKLKPQTVANVESSLLQQLVNKYTLGEFDEVSAVNFPGLAQAMKPYNFQSANARNIKRTTEMLAEVYRNDQKLLNSTAGLHLDKAATTLTADPIAHARYSGFRRALNYIHKYLPGASADNAALVEKLNKLFLDPTDANISKQVLANVKSDEQLTAAISRIQADLAKDAIEGKTAKVKLYRDSKGTVTVTPGPGKTDMGQSLPMHRVMGAADALAILAKDALDLTKADKAILIDKGFVAIAKENGELIRLTEGK